LVGDFVRSGGQPGDSFEYDVAVSFAGEQRAAAHAIAACLAAAGLRVFYDLYQEAELWGKDLYEHLADVYGKKARYCLMLVSKDYAAKLWTTHERRSAYARALRQSQEYILPVRFDETEIPGLSPNVAYVRFEDHNAEGICRLVVSKLQGASVAYETGTRAADVARRVVRLTRIVDLNEPDWSGLIPPKACLDVWVRYQGHDQLFLDEIELFHVETELTSAASGAFPPSQRYTLGYESDSRTTLFLQPSLTINPDDQSEIHFELEVYPKRTVGGCGCCVAFLKCRNSANLTGKLPLLKPDPMDVAVSRVLGRPIAVSIFNLCLATGHLKAQRVPRDTSYLVESTGSVMCELTAERFPMRLDSTPNLVVALSTHGERALQVAMSGIESEPVAIAAIELIAMIGLGSAPQMLRRIESEAPTEYRRLVARNLSHRKKPQASSTDTYGPLSLLRLIRYMSPCPENVQQDLKYLGLRPCPSLEEFLHRGGS
jgi:hypothetical protein